MFVLATLCFYKLCEQLMWLYSTYSITCTAKVCFGLFHTLLYARKIGLNILRVCSFWYGCGCVIWFCNLIVALQVYIRTWLRDVLFGMRCLSAQLVYNLVCIAKALCLLPAEYGERDSHRRSHS